MIALALLLPFSAHESFAKALDCLAATGLGPNGAPRTLSPTSAAEREPPLPGTTTLVMLPDIQYYTKCALPHLAAQTEWLAAQALPRNIRAAMFMGDLTEHNTPGEWRFVRDQLALAEWQVPLLLAAGNHDMGKDGNTHKRITLMSQFFPQPPGIAQALLAETRVPGNIENAYYRIDLPLATIGVLALEWAPRRSTIAWANAVLARHPTDRVIIVTHAYLYDDSTRYDWIKNGDKQLWNPLSYRMARTEARKDPEQDGEMLWNALVRRHAGIFLVLCAHVGGSGVAQLTSRGDEGNLVHQVLANYQLLDEGGQGWLRLLEISPDGERLRMKTYSPSLGRFATGDAQRGEFQLVPALW